MELKTGIQEEHSERWKLFLQNFKTWRKKPQILQLEKAKENSSFCLEEDEGNWLLYFHSYLD